MTTKAELIAKQLAAFANVKDQMGSVPLQLDYTPSVIRSHFGNMRGQWYAEGEGTGDRIYSVSTAAAAGAQTINLVSTAGLIVNQLIVYLATDGQYYSAQVDGVTSTTITIRQALEQPISPGNNVFPYYQNASHPGVYGYRALADYAIRSLNTNRGMNEKEVVVSLENVYVNKDGYFTSVQGTETLTNTTIVNQYVPGSVMFNALQVVGVASGYGIRTLYMRLTGEVHKYRILANIGTSGIFTVTIKSKSGQQLGVHTFTTSGSCSRLIEGTFKARHDDDVCLELTHSNSASFFQLGNIEIIRLEENRETLDSGVHVLLGDSYFVQEGIYDRLKQRLPQARFINKGVGGNQAIDLINRFDTDVTPNNPDYVWIMVGTNDYYARLDPKIFASRVDQLIAKITAIGAKPILFEPSVGAQTAAGYADKELTELSRNYTFITKYLNQSAQNGINPLMYEIKTAINNVSASTTTIEACLGTVPTGSKLEMDWSGGYNLSATCYIEVGFSTSDTAPFEQSIKVTTISANKGANVITSTNPRFIFIRRVNASGGAVTFGGVIKIRVTRP